jgi:hypothetical protein
MKRSIALAVTLVLGGLPAGAGAVAHWASTAAAHPAPAQVTTALTTGARDAQGLPGPLAKMAAPSLLAICGMSVNNPPPSPTAWLGSVSSEDISTVKLAQCYFSDPLDPLNRTALHLNGVPGLFTTPADGQRTRREPVPGPSSATIRRQLREGTSYRLVKVPYRPADLEKRLRRSGWHINLTPTSGPFYWGAGSRG